MPYYRWDSQAMSIWKELVEEGKPVAIRAIRFGGPDFAGAGSRRVLGAGVSPSGTYKLRAGRIILLAVVVPVKVIDLEP